MEKFIRNLEIKKILLKFYNMKNVKRDTVIMIFLSVITITVISTLIICEYYN